MVLLEVFEQSVQVGQLKATAVIALAEILFELGQAVTSV